MKINQMKAITACTPLLLSMSVSSALAQAVPGGTLDPTTIPKYVSPLVIPPVLYDDQGGTAPIGDPIPAPVALRAFTQQILPAGFPETTVWGYGDPERPGTVAEGGSFFNPSFTIEVTADTLTAIKWQNQLVDADGNYLPHVITDGAGNPIIDQTLHWAAPNQECRDGEPRTDCRGTSDQPYTGPIPMVVHVHGAHVGPGSDGYPEAWWLPAAENIPPGYATNGTFFESDEGADTANAIGKGYAIDKYPNDQPTTTLWYHDHTLGITRLNVYASGAGFYLIRDENDGESGLVSGTLPGPAPQSGDDPNGDATTRASIREIPIAIQPKSFNADGSQYYPADRQFFEGLGEGQDFALNDQMFSLVTEDGAFPFLPQANSDIAPVWNPEAFFNTMVVNGQTWPFLDVAPERYRFRMVNAADSRFLNMALYVVNADGSLGQEIPFYQIGSDQSLLPQVARIQTGFATSLPGDGRDACPTAYLDLLNRLPPLMRDRVAARLTQTCVFPEPGFFADQALLMGPAERADVIVDFSNLPDGTRVRMTNTAADAPFGGFPDAPADPGTTGQVMEFVVSSVLANPSGDPSTPPRSLALSADPGGVPKLGPPDVIRDLALLEEESSLLCVIFDAVTGAVTHIAGDPIAGCPTINIGGVDIASEPFAPKEAVLGVNGSGGLGTAEVQLWDDPIAQNPAVNNVETWELWNLSADAHPIHLHLVKFEVVDREIIGGAVRGPEPWETGWKDSVIAYPDEVTRVKAKFDVAGLYVWHCHILSHEDNEMMVPYCVGTPGEDCPAELF